MRPEDEAEAWLECDRSEEEDEADASLALLPEDCEVWHDYLSGELSSLWLSCKEFIEANAFPILDECSYADFVQFCFERSSKRVTDLNA